MKMTVIAVVITVVIVAPISVGVTYGLSKLPSSGEGGNDYNV
jgi:hypothetical protein